MKSVTKLSLRLTSPRYSKKNLKWLFQLFRKEKLFWISGRRNSKLPGEILRQSRQSRGGIFSPQRRYSVHLSI